MKFRWIASFVTALSVFHGQLFAEEGGLTVNSTQAEIPALHQNSINLPNTVNDITGNQSTNNQSRIEQSVNKEALISRSTTSKTDTSKNTISKTTPSHSAELAASPLELNKEQVKADEATVTISYTDERDPIEGFNRAIWDFNYLFMDRYFYRPVAHGYNDYIPMPVKTGVNNFVLNLEEPNAIVNNTLQGKWGWVANAGGRFTINTTLGLLGVIDVADMMGLPRKQDDFNEVLGYYGVPNGPYFMAPFLGPYVTRELASDWVDDLYFPLSELTIWQSLLKWGLKSLHSRASAIDQERLVDNALDPYTFVKEAYFQHMDYKVYDGNVPVDQDEDDLLDEYMQELD